MANQDHLLAEITRVSRLKLDALVAKNHAEHEYERLRAEFNQCVSELERHIRELRDNAEQKI
jgi:F0F1-type ATP synthase membrane subunit b/b'